MAIESVSPAQSSQTSNPPGVAAGAGSSASALGVLPALTGTSPGTTAASIAAAAPSSAGNAGERAALNFLQLLTQSQSNTALGVGSDAKAAAATDLKPAAPAAGKAADSDSDPTDPEALCAALAFVSQLMASPPATSTPAAAGAGGSPAPAATEQDAAASLGAACSATSATGSMTGTPPAAVPATAMPAANPTADPAEESAADRPADEVADRAAKPAADPALQPAAAKSVADSAAQSSATPAQAGARTDDFSIRNLVSMLQNAGSDAEPARPPGLRTDTADAPSQSSSDAKATDPGVPSSVAPTDAAVNPHLSVGSHFHAPQAPLEPHRADVRSPVGTSAWADELGGKITWMAKEGIESASLRVSPEHLGPVDVHISVQDGATSVMFGAAQADTRSALEQALPRLREMFATQGLTLADAGVSREPPRQQNRPAQIPPAAPLSGVSDESAVPVSTAARMHLGLLDTYA